MLKEGTIGIPHWRKEPISTKVAEVVDANHVRVDWLGKTFLVKTPTSKLKKDDPFKIDFVVYVRKRDNEVILERFTPKSTNK